MPDTPPSESPGAGPSGSAAKDETSQTVEKPYRERSFREGGPSRFSAPISHPIPAPPSRGRGRGRGLYASSFSNRRSGGDTWESGQDRDRDRDRDRQYDRRSRSPRRDSGSASRATSTAQPSPSRHSRASRSRSRSKSRSRSRSRNPRSASPEEGQITSPSVHANSSRPAYSRRSPSPRKRWDDRPASVRGGYRGGRGGFNPRFQPYRRDERDTYRDNERERDEYRSRDRDRDRDRDRERERERDRDRNYPPRRVSRSPPARSRRSSRSPSTTSSYRSSRYNSPDKRDRDRDRDLSPIKRPRSPSPARSYSKSFRDVPETPVIPPPRKILPIPVAVPMHGHGGRFPIGPRGDMPIPPTGPRSDRPIPLGPRGFTMPAPPTPVPVASTPAPAAAVTAPTSTIKEEPVEPTPVVNPYRAAPSSSSAATLTPPAPRLSWSERKKLSPSTGTFASSASPIPAPAQLQQQIKREPPSDTGLQRDHNQDREQGYDATAASRSRPDSRSRSPMTPPLPPPPIPFEVEVKQEPIDHAGAETYTARRPSTPPPPPPDHSPVANTVPLRIPTGPAKTEPNVSVSVSVSPLRPAAQNRLKAEDIKPKIEPVDPAVLEAQRQEMRRLEEERKILAELPLLNISFVGAWEADLEQFRSTYLQLETSTLRSQAAARSAGAVLADVEAERIHATERRKVAEEQLLRGQGTLAAVGLMGV